MGLVTGSATGTYIKFDQDMASVATKSELNLIVKKSDGLLANIHRMVSRENAAIEIVQFDVLGFLTLSTQVSVRQLANQQ
ncbi:MAG: hypothetical protein OER96_11470 [Gammaproteobacteria bacterium]|nr:hypothetical protein [Gammaproteobacteria bacterium]